MSSTRHFQITSNAWSTVDRECPQVLFTTNADRIRTKSDYGCLDSVRCYTCTSHCCLTVILSYLLFLQHPRLTFPNCLTPSRHPCPPWGRFSSMERILCLLYPRRCIFSLDDLRHLPHSRRCCPHRNLRHCSRTHPLT